MKSEKDCISKKIIQFLELGIITYDGIDRITVDTEETRIAKDWINKKDGSLVIVAPYGSGKTHMNKFMEKIALEQGYIVSYLQFNSQTPMHLPGKIFEHIFRNMKYLKDGKIANIHNIIDEYVRFKHSKGENSKNWFFNHPYLHPLYQIVSSLHRTGKTIDDSRYFRMWKYIFEGGRKYEYEMTWMPPNNFSTTSNLFFDIFMRINLAAKELGHKGIILLFDELEQSDYTNRSNWKVKSTRFMKALSLISKNDPRLATEKVSRMYDYDLNQDATLGEETDLIYFGPKNNIRYVPPGNNLDLNIKCSFSIVEGQGVAFYDLAKEFGFPIITLGKLTYEKQTELIKKIILIFKESVKNDSEIDDEFYDKFIKDFEEIEEKFLEKIMNIIESDETDNSVRRLVRLTVKGLNLFKKIRKNNLEELLELN
jgi:hypothetical protein